MSKDPTLGMCSLVLAVGFPALAAVLFVGSIKQSNEAAGCPIVFDLNGNGYIDTVGHMSSQEKVYSVFSIEKYVNFDIFATGEPREIDWISGGKDAFLIDLSNGIPDGNLTGLHLFGTVGQTENGEIETYEHGFQKLAKLDLNGDQTISGDELENLALWKDDGDGQFEETELVQLDDIGVVAIPTSPSIEPGPYGSEVISAFASTTDGSRMYIEDVWFMTPEDPLDEHRRIGRFFNSLGM